MLYLSCSNRGNMGRQFQISVVGVLVIMSIVLIVTIVMNLQLQNALNITQDEFSRILNSTQQIEDPRPKWTKLKTKLNELSRKNDILNRSIKTLERQVTKQKNEFQPAAAHLWLDLTKTRRADGTLLWRSTREQNNDHFVNGGISSGNDGVISVTDSGVYLFHGHICFDTFLNGLEKKSELIRIFIVINRRISGPMPFSKDIIDLVKVKRYSYLSTCFVGSRKLAAGDEFFFMFESRVSTQYIAYGNSSTCNSLTIVRVF
ncbi:uncharacterized protein LOC124262145 [Haliotis rubra]|uniref:uncharacterized protein LOC124262145 n=1 Tax=Haliotis rubra TaxID=36100 RepID=UPI001EE5F7F0|nr:uncharacterized protein LOC124262145 [Haliotis rubra]